VSIETSAHRQAAVGRVTHVGVRTVAGEHSAYLKMNQHLYAHTVEQNDLMDRDNNLNSS
jgi:hypothetical protein